MEHNEMMPGFFNLTEKEPTNFLEVISEEKDIYEVLSSTPEDEKVLSRPGAHIAPPPPIALPHQDVRRSSSNIHEEPISPAEPQSPVHHHDHHTSDTQRASIAPNAPHAHQFDRRSSGSEDGAEVDSDLDFGGEDIYDEKAWDTDLEVDDAFDSYDHSGRSAYIDACRHLGVIPASYFLRHMEDRCLDMRHHGLGTTGIKAISQSLVSNAHVVKLNLCDNWLGKEGSLAVCGMLKENCFITEIDLSENRLGFEFVETLTDALQTNTTLTHINVTGNFIGDRGAELFANIINNTKHLEYINLSNNGLSEMAGIMLGPAISENSCIKSLDLSWNSIRRRGAVAVAIGIKNNVYLKKMNLAWNGFGTEGACALGDALKTNAALEELDISNNRIMTEGAVWIGKGLAFNENLIILKLGRNPMESGGCFAVCAAVLRNPTSVLRHLDFTDIEVNEDCVKIMKDLKSQFADILVTHGSWGQGHGAAQTRVHPMYKLRHYMSRNGLRIVDVFNKFDKDQSLRLTRREFMQGIVETGIKLTEEEIEALVEQLDKDGDGEVNYSELVSGNSEYIEQETRQASVTMITLKQ